MNIPARYAKLLGRKHLTIDVLSDCPCVSRARLSVHPGGRVGNGDNAGLYWPIGREVEEPLVAMMSHDCWAIIPEASSLETFKLVSNFEDDPFDDEDEDADDDEEEVEDEEQGDHKPSLQERLALDPRSPYLLVANADAAAARNELDQAVALYEQAVSILPEYTAAHIGLVMAYRRLRKPSLVIRSLVNTIRCPLSLQGASFWSENALPLNRHDFRRKSLLWLQQASQEDAEGVADDPLFRVRAQLTFATGLKTIDDFALYDQAIQEYTSRGMFPEAIQLLMLYGELMWNETVSFRERSEFTMPKFRDRLQELFQLAGSSRVAFL